MNPLVKEMPKHTKFNNLLKSIKEGESNLSITGLTDSAKAHVIYSLYNYSNKRPVIVCPNITSAKKIMQDIKFYADKEIIYLPAREVIYYDIDVQSMEIENARVYAINKLLSGDNFILVTTVDALMQPMPPKEVYDDLALTLEDKKEVDLEYIIRTLDRLGYERESLVQSKGQFSIRGGIIDIFPIDEDNPYRIELFGKEVDSIRTFDISSQRSINNVDKIKISFSNEYIFDKDKIENCIKTLEEYIKENNSNSDLKAQILKDIESLKENNIKKCIDRYFNILLDKKGSLIDYLDNQFTIYFNEVSKCISRTEAINYENNESLKVMTEKNYVYPKYAYKSFSFDELESRLKSLSVVYISTLNEDRVLHAKRKEYSFSCREVNFFRSTMDILIQDIKKYIEEGKLIFAVFSTEVRIESVKNALIDNSIRVKYIESIDILDEPVTGVVYITKGIVSSGFLYEEFNITLISEQISGTIRKSKKTSEKFLGDILNSYEDLKVGEYVVHINHGIGQYLGIETVEVNGVIKDYIKILYKDGGVLYITITSMDNIKKYVCEEGYKPKLNKLGTGEWEKTKAKVSKHVTDVAKDLILLYAKRLEAKRICLF